MAPSPLGRSSLSRWVTLLIYRVIRLVSTRFVGRHPSTFVVLGWPPLFLHSYVPFPSLHLAFPGAEAGWVRVLASFPLLWGLSS